MTENKSFCSVLVPLLLAIKRLIFGLEIIARKFLFFSYEYLSYQKDITIFIFIKDLKQPLYLLTVPLDI